jgi:hypothetical protein
MVKKACKTQKSLVTYFVLCQQEVARMKVMQASQPPIRDPEILIECQVSTMDRGTAKTEQHEGVNSRCPVVTVFTLEYSVYA